MYDWQFDRENGRVPNLARLDAGNPPALWRKLHLAMVLNGVDYLSGLGTMYLNARFTEQDIEKVIDPFDRSLARLNKEKMI